MVPLQVDIVKILQFISIIDINSHKCKIKGYFRDKAADFLFIHMLSCNMYL